MKYLPAKNACLCIAVALMMIGCSPEYSVRPTPPSNTTTNTTETPTATVESPQNEAESVPAETVAETPAEEIERINFDDLNCGIQADIVFRDWMLSPRAKELDGKRVRLAGYMLADGQLKGIEEFVLLKNTECKFGPNGQADHLARIVFTGEATADFTNRPIDVIGTLHFKPWVGIDGNTWAIYEIAAEKVQPMRR